MNCSTVKPALDLCFEQSCLNNARRKANHVGISHLNHTMAAFACAFSSAETHECSNRFALTDIPWDLRHTCPAYVVGENRKPPASQGAGGSEPKSGE